MSAGSFDASLAWLAASPDSHTLLARCRRGLEKECLRVGPDGRLSERPHPEQLGSALTHPWLTTDYSEALLEFVTPPYESLEQTLGFLEDLQTYVVMQAGDELLWPESMPCIVGADEAVPIAQYGPSNEGRLRSIYRSGLGFRYGRAMQAIAGTHFNFSLPEAFWAAWHAQAASGLSLQAFKSERFMGLVRNYRRYGWIVTYLYGASPAFCKSFRREGHPRLKSLNADTWYAPYSTSLRMSDMGYRNSTQSRLSIPVNSLDEYIDELERALSTPEPRYEAIGVRVDGEYRQLSANVLQLENEYYSSIRPKPASKQPRLIAALRATGIEYVEVRTLDLNPFEPLGVTAGQCGFIESLLLFCLVADSPPITEAEQAEIGRRELDVAWEGRRPGLEIPRNGGSTGLVDWADELLGDIAAAAAVFDGGDGQHTSAVHAAREAVHDSGLTLSARVLEALGHGERTFFDWAFATARANREYFLARGLDSARHAELERLAAESLERADALAAADEPPFEEYLAAFIASGAGEAEPAARRRNL